MDSLQYLTKNIQETENAVRRIEDEIRLDADRPTLQLTLASLRKRQRDLEQDFALASQARLRDIFRYRMFSAENAELDSHPPIAGIARILANFQDCFTTVYAAVVSGEKQNAEKQKSSKVYGQTELHYGYTFAGSLGFGLTLEDENILVGQTNVERSLETLFAIAGASTTEQVFSYAEILGTAPIQSLYRWAKAHAEIGLGTEVDWQHDNSSLTFRLDRNQLEALQKVIEETTDEVVEEFTITGRLTGIDVNQRTFRLEWNSGSAKGKVREAIINAGPLTVPALYTARLRRTTYTKIATGEEKVSFLLLSLQPPEENVVERVPASQPTTDNSLTLFDTP